MRGLLLKAFKPQLEIKNKGCISADSQTDKCET